MLVLRLENPGDLDRQRRAADPQLTSDDSRGSRSGRLAIAIPHRRHAGKRGGPLDLDVAHHGLDIEALVQRDQIAALKTAQQDSVSA